jgi:hypothetical protein
MVTITSFSPETEPQDRDDVIAIRPTSQLVTAPRPNSAFSLRNLAVAAGAIGAVTVGFFAATRASPSELHTRDQTITSLDHDELRSNQTRQKFKLGGSGIELPTEKIIPAQATCKLSGPILDLDPFIMFQETES